MKKDKNKIDLVLAISLLLLVIVIIIVRRPEFITSPRFWAEEGEIYFSDAFHHGFWSSLFHQHMGYYNFVPNLATALATLVSLENAPLVTTCIALLFQALVSAILIFSDSPFWDNWSKKVVIACGIQVINPYEVWLTTICVHFWLCIATFFILLDRPSEHSYTYKYFQRGMLIIAGLSGVVSIFLTPLYLLKAWRNQLRELWIQSGILVSSALLQITVFISVLMRKSDLDSSRFESDGFLLSDIVRFHVYDPFISELLQKYISHVFSQILLAAIAVYLMYLMFSIFHDREYQPIVISYSIIVILSTVLSLHMASAA